MPQTTPLTKAVATTEGILVIASDLVFAPNLVGAAHSVSPKLAAIVVGAQHLALLAQRGLIKYGALKQVQAVIASPDPVQAAEKAILGDINATPAA